MDKSIKSEQLKALKDKPISETLKKSIDEKLKYVNKPIKK